METRLCDHSPLWKALSAVHFHDHSSDVCKDCWQTYLEGQIASKPSDRIRCAQCPRLLTDSEIKRLGSGETYEE